MQLKTLAILIVMLSFLSGCYGKDCLTKQTTNPKHLERLLKTNKCPGCNLGDANLSQANLMGADLSRAELVNANLDGVNLEGANLKGTQFAWYDYDAGWGTRNSCDVDLAASLRKANLAQVNLEGANLQRVNLAQVNLEGANLQRVNLANAFFIVRKFCA